MSTCRRVASASYLAVSPEMRTKDETTTQRVCNFVLDVMNILTKKNSRHVILTEKRQSPRAPSIFLPKLTRARK
jgi:energy-coupling factor transporter ATP-binding protein EcfA2